MNLTENLNKIMQKIEDPTEGLPEEIFEFVSSITPMINVDLLIRDEQGRILLARRNDKFEGMVWHIPGGIIRFKEEIEKRIEHVGYKEIDQKIKFGSKPIAINEIMVEHQERGHFISLLYECKLTEKICVQDKEHYNDGDLYWFGECPRDFMECQKNIYSKFFVNNCKE